jgi:hypothetical protein
MTGLKWTRKTLRALQRAMQRKGFKVGLATTRRLLHKLRYTLRVNRKRLTRKQEPERDRQMRYLVRLRRRFLKAGKPVISVDTKKRELVGNFKNAGRTWRRDAIPVLEYDYPSWADGVAIPYGLYDLGANEGFVVIGASHQTPEFACAAIRLWWLKVGRFKYHSDSFADRRLQMEPRGTPAVFAHQHELGWATVGELRNSAQVYSQNEN